MPELKAFKDFRLILKGKDYEMLGCPKLDRSKELDKVYYPKKESCIWSFVRYLRVL